MNKYIVHFTTNDGDYDKEWCYADSEAEARNIIMHDHWNIKTIDMIVKERK